MIRIRNLTKSFKGKVVLDNLSLDVLSGRSLALIGRSGNGKSVLLKCIIGLLKPDCGEIQFANSKRKEPSGQLNLDKFGMLFQGSALFDSLSVWENVAFRLLHGKNRIPRLEARERAIKKLKRTGLPHAAADAYPAELSGGMQKRAALARAIMTDPEIIFFDEPTTGLDPIMAGIINRLIRGVVDDLGATTVTVTHDLESVATIADDVAMLEGGGISYTGNVKDMRTADDPFLQQFLAGSADGPINVRE